MRTIIFLFSFLIFNSFRAQNTEKIPIPQGVVYKYADAKIVEKAKKLIVENLKSNEYSLIQSNLMIGLGLWKRFKNIQKLND